MPRRETRHDIERDMTEARHNRAAARGELGQLIAAMKDEIARMRGSADQAKLTRIRSEFNQSIRRLVEVRRRRRRPGGDSMPALVEPPRGPKPLAGGAAAPLEFD